MSGMAPDVLDQAFKMATGAASDVINTDNGAVMLRVVDKAEVTPTDFTAAKETFREQLLSERRNRFFGAYMSKAKQKMKIEVNREAHAAGRRLAHERKRHQRQDFPATEQRRGACQAPQHLPLPARQVAATSTSRQRRPTRRPTSVG